MSTNDGTLMDKLLNQLRQQDLSSTPASQAEKFFDSIGLMRGSYAPAGRAAFGFAASGALLWAIRPGFAFDENGSPRPWSATSPSEYATKMPWFIPSLLAAAYCGLFI